MNTAKNNSIENVASNEKIIDNQTVFIAIGILANLFFVSNLSVNFASSLVLKIIIAAMVIFSTISLLLCLIAPSIIIHKRRKLKNALQNRYAKASPNNLIEEQELIDLEKRMFLSGILKMPVFKIEIALIELLRLVFIVLAILSVCSFYLYILFFA